MALKTKPSANSTNQANFFLEALGDFLHIGAFLPTSSWAAESIAAEVANDSTRVVEYGAGNGTVTRRILSRLESVNARLIALEMNHALADELQTIDDPRLIVVRGDVKEWASHLANHYPGGIDAVVSGVPFAFLDENERDFLVQCTHKALRPGGKFIVYATTLKSKAALKRYFGDIKIGFEPRNFLPYFLLTATKV